MLEALVARPQDPLLGLLRLHAADARTDRIDLGVGVYRDATGATPVLAPVLAPVEEAERRVWERQASETHQGLEGDREFLSLFGHSLLGRAGPAMAGVQTIGGWDALRLACDLLHEAGARRILVGLPTPERVARLREERGICMAASGPINLAGLRERAVPRPVAALAPAMAPAEAA